jgi:hypothetical protein
VVSSLNSLVRFLDHKKYILASKNSKKNYRDRLEHKGLKNKVHRARESISKSFHKLYLDLKKVKYPIKYGKFSKQPTRCLNMFLKAFHNKNMIYNQHEYI